MVLAAAGWTSRLCIARSRLSTRADIPPRGDAAPPCRAARVDFGWEPQPFASPTHLVVPHGDGVDSGLLASRDGEPGAKPACAGGGVGGSAGAAAPGSG
jgi:hypothetical protein